MATAAAGTTLNGTAQPGELYAFQLGVWAVHKPVTLSLATVDWTDLSSGDAAAAIPSRLITCSNIEGVDFRGQAFTQAKTIPKGTLGSVWLLVPVPPDAAPGTEYTGRLTVEHVFDIELTVNKTATAPIPNAGADDLWRMARLGWLDSTLGIDRSVSAPYSPVTVADGASSIVVEVSQHNRSVSFGGAGGGSGFTLVDAISVAGKPVLAASVVVAVDGDTIVGGAPTLARHDAASAMIVRIGRSAGKDLLVNSTVEVNYDGYIEVAIALQATGASALTKLRNVSVTWTLPVAAAKYAMGLGKEGYTRSNTYPAGIGFNWTADNTNNGRNQLWVGNYNRGLRMKWKGESSDWNSPLHTQFLGPPLWAGDSGISGGITMSPEDDCNVVITGFTGLIVVNRTAKVLKLDMLVTPVKELDLATHFSRDRYYQYGYNGRAGPSDIADMGVKVLNLHQGTDLNPFINYPFDPVASDLMKNFSDTAKSLGVKSTCIYYTTRELSNRCYEMPTLMNLATPTDHVYDTGEDGGAPWLQEHLPVGGYTRRWSNALDGGQMDAAIGDASLSRWVNYYVRGLSWLRSNGPRIDGLYLDELSFGRETMQRMRKAADVKPGALFDLHSCSKSHCGIAPYAPHSSSMLIYAAHFPYLNSLWFGEGFSSDAEPDFWLIEMSGLAFGIPAEQLSSPNLWRGMVFAEGARPAPALWKAWDAYALTTPGTTLVGWWDDEPLATVSGADVAAAGGVKASVYVIPGSPPRYVLAIASWAQHNVTVSIQFDAGIGSHPMVSALEIDNFQPAVASIDAAALEIAPGKGWLLAVDPS